MFKKVIATILLAVGSVLCAQTPVIGLPGGSGGPISPTQVTFPDSSVQVSAAYRTPGIWVSPNCPSSNATCVKVFADTKYVTDATTNSTTTVTCPDCNFTQSDVGKVAWATTQGTGAGIGLYNYTTFVCPQTTIASVTNSTTIILTNTCTATGAGNVVFIWGHDDGAALAAMDTNYGCNVIHLATSNTFIMTGQPFAKTPASTSVCNTALRLSTGAPNPALIGDGFGASQAVIIMTPNFNWAACASGGCIGSGMRVLANLQIWGTGLTAASNANCANGSGKTVVGAWSASSEIVGVDVNGICPDETGMAGVQMNNADETFSYGGVQSVGQYACYATTASAMSLLNNDCRNDNVVAGYGLYITNGAQVTSYSSSPIVGTFITGTGSTLVSIQSQYLKGGPANSVELASGGKFISYVDSIGGTVKVNSGTTFVTQSTTFTNSITNAGTVISVGNNKLGQLVTTQSGSWLGTGVLFGACKGTATSSATLGLYGLGQFSTSACTSTTVASGVATPSVPLSGSVFGLQCNATHAGVSASSGVVTVLKNGVATTLTCTIGTGTTCVDNSHFDIPTVGDVYSIQFTTQPSEVLAGVSCSVLNW